MLEPQVERLKQQIEQNYKYNAPRTFTGISVDGTEFIDVSTIVIRKMAELYTRALGLGRMDVINLQNPRWIELIEQQQNSNHQPVVYLAKKGVKQLEFLVAKEKRVIAAGMGHNHDVFQTIYFVGHEEAIDFVLDSVSPGKEHKMEWSAKSAVEHAKELGIPVPVGALEEDGRRFTYVITAPISVESFLIKRPFQMNLGTYFSRVYDYWSF